MARQEFLDGFSKDGGPDLCSHQSLSGRSSDVPSEIKSVDHACARGDSMLAWYKTKPRAITRGPVGRGQWFVTGSEQISKYKLAHNKQMYITGLVGEQHMNWMGPASIVRPKRDKHDEPNRGLSTSHTSF